MPYRQIAPEPDTLAISQILLDESSHISDSHRLFWTDLDKSGQICTPDATIPCPDQHFLSNPPKSGRTDSPARFGYPPFKTA